MSRLSVKNELSYLNSAVSIKANELREFNSEYVPDDLKEIIDVRLPFVANNEEHKKQHLILLLAILSLIPNSYKKRLNALSIMCQRLEEAAITSIYRTDEYKDPTTHEHEPMKLIYAKLAKEYLKQIKAKYGYIDTQDFTFLYPEEKARKIKSYDVNYLSNTQVLSIIDSILQKSSINSNSPIKENTRQCPLAPLIKQERSSQKSNSPTLIKRERSSQKSRSPAYKKQSRFI